MKVFLMYRDRDFGVKEELPPNAADLTRDLELDTLFGVGDPFLVEVFRKAVLTSLRDTESILYRQQILSDCMEHADIVRSLYQIAVDALDQEKRIWRVYGNFPSSALHRAIEVLGIFMGIFKRLRSIADEHGPKFRSEGFTRLFSMIREELDDDYLGVVQSHMRRLAFRGGILMTAELGKGNKGSNYVLRKPQDIKEGWLARIQTWVEDQLPGRDRDPSFEIADRDEAGFRALSDLTGRGIGNVAAALAQSTDHIQSFFGMLRLELAFYVCCLNLRDRLVGKGEPICFPEPAPIPAMGERPFLAARGLYDVCLSLNIDDRVVGNDVAAVGKSLVMITGANRGGKSTFLRGVGIAQLMMQSGMFVPAESFRASLCDGIFTHFKREEDATMKSGKLDEELARMSSITDRITPGSVVLFNESFASTNEREGSEIARQIVRALLESRVKVLYVTHMFDLARSFYRAGRDDALFLRAERLADGQRTFRLFEGEPLPTSYGEDLYRRIFGKVLQPTEAMIQN